MLTSDFMILPLMEVSMKSGEGQIGSPTAPVERAHSDRARSGSTGEPSAHDRTPMMMNQQPLISDLTDSGLEFAIFSLASFHLLH